MKIHSINRLTKATEQVYTFEEQTNDSTETELKPKQRHIKKITGRARTSTTSTFYIHRLLGGIHDSIFAFLLLLIMQYSSI